MNPINRDGKASKKDQNFEPRNRTGEKQKLHSISKDHQYNDGKRIQEFIPAKEQQIER